MRVNLLLGAALVVACLPAAARADDPNDPTMRSPAARARDHERIRQLNLAELRRTQARDARLAQGWAAYRGANGGRGRFVREEEYAGAADEHDRAMARYTQRRSDYERRMAEWRRAVAACRAGDYDACGN